MAKLCSHANANSSRNIYITAWAISPTSLRYIIWSNRKIGYLQNGQTDISIGSAISGHSSSKCQTNMRSWSAIRSPNCNRKCYFFGLLLLLRFQSLVQLTVKMLFLRYWGYDQCYFCGFGFYKASELSPIRNQKCWLKVNLRLALSNGKSSLHSNSWFIEDLTRGSCFIEFIKRYIEKGSNARHVELFIAFLQGVE